MAHDVSKADTPEQEWDTTPFPGWRDTVNRWSWRSTGTSEWEKSGPCPRCQHQLTLSKRGGWTFAFSVDALEDDLLTVIEHDQRGTIAVEEREAETGFFARCNCGEKHPGRPSEITGGCGQAARIDAPAMS
jgi:hypothetical protein